MITILAVIGGIVVIAAVLLIIFAAVAIVDRFLNLGISYADWKEQNQ